MSETIAAVVVTYNRKDLLLDCLDALLNQTRPVDAIILIDNASTDGTQETLREKGYLKNLKIDYMRLPENTGGAGGFHAGIKRGYKNGFDFLWLMDDDVESSLSCLDEMFKYRDFSLSIHPKKYYSDGSEHIWGPKYDIRKLKAVQTPYRLFQKSNMINVDTCNFEGMLIHKSIIEKVGYPDEAFFISGDDTEYGLRIAKHTHIVCIKSAIMLRKVKPKNLDVNRSVAKRSSSTRRVVDINDYWKEYYYLRNLFLIKKHHDLGIIQLYWIFIESFKRLTGIFIHNDSYKLVRIKLIKLALVDGLSGKFGKSFEAMRNIKIG